MSDFTTLVAKHKMKFVEMPVSHYDVMSKRAIKRDRGVCVGITTVYLASFGRSKDDPMEGDFAASLCDDKQLFVIKQIQQMEDSREITFGIVLEKKRDAGTYVDMFAGVGLGNAFASNLTALGCKNVRLNQMDQTGYAAASTFPFASLARFCAKFAGVHLIKFPKHVCGVIVDDEKFFYAFLDVNYGQASTSNAHVFRQFLTDFFTSETAKEYDDSNSTAGVLHVVL